MTMYRDEIEVLRPDLGENVGAVFTLREGGVSSGPWGGVDGVMGLNVGSHVEDNAACVKMNRSIVAQLAPADPKWMTQVHGIRVVDAESVTDDTLEADAQTSLTPNVVCTVQVADCLPVLVAEVNGKGVAAIHAGWKGLALGVIEAGVCRLRERLGDQAKLRAWLGPRIGAQDFEVGQEVKKEFDVRYKDCIEAQKKLPNGKYCLDLATYAKFILARLGVDDVQDCGFSTAADAKRFFSFRRDGAKSGRHAGLIWIKG